MEFGCYPAAGGFGPAFSMPMPTKSYKNNTALLKRTTPAISPNLKPALAPQTSRKALTPTFGTLFSPTNRSPARAHVTQPLPSLKQSAIFLGSTARLEADPANITPSFSLQNATPSPSANDLTASKGPGAAGSPQFVLQTQRAPSEGQSLIPDSGAGTTLEASMQYEKEPLGSNYWRHTPPTANSNEAFRAKVPLAAASVIKGQGLAHQHSVQCNCYQANCFRRLLEEAQMQSHSCILSIEDSLVVYARHVSMVKLK